jgi:gliding motility-associated-like protein
MKITVHALVIAVSLILFDHAAKAQTITTGAGGPCTNFPLTLMEDASKIYKIEWFKNYSSVEQTTYREWVNPVVVAGTEGSYGSSATQLGYPKRIFVTSTGSVYVTDRSAGRVQRWDPPYTSGVTVATGLDWPEDIQIDFFGNILVSEHWGKRITQWPAGITVANISGGAEGMGMGPGGIIYVVNYWGQRVEAYPPFFNTGTPATVKAGVTNSSGNANNQLNFPGDIYVDALGNMYVIDVDNDRIMYFPFLSAEGFPGIPIVSNFSFDSYSSIYRDSYGYLYFTNTSGAYILEPGSSSPRQITTWGSGGIQTDPSGNLYVVGAAPAHCVKRFSPDVNMTFTPTSAGSYTAFVHYLDGTVKITNSINVLSGPSTPVVSSNSPVCSGIALNLFANSSAGALYEWTGPSSYVSGAQNPVINSPVTANSGTYQVTAADGGNGCRSNTVNLTVSVLPSPVPSVTISPDAGTNVFCAGLPTSFTATPVNGGTSPGYQWTINSNNAGTGNKLSTAALNNGDIIRCRLTSNAVCATPVNVNSNTITMSVSPPATLGAATNCAGSILTVSSTANIAAINWYKDGSLQSSGVSKTFTAVSAGTYHAVVKSQEGCSSTTNNIVINANNTPAVGIASPDIIICEGTTVTFTASVVNAGTNPVLQWSRNGVASGTGISYSPPVVQQGDVFNCNLTVAADAGCVTSATAISNNITMTVNPKPVVTLQSNMPNPVCGNVAETFSVATSAATPQFQWKLNEVNTGSNNQTYAIAAVNNGDVVKCIVTDISAATACSDSTFTTLVVKPMPVMLTTTGNTSVCLQKTTQLTNATLNNGFQWKSLQPGVAAIDNAGNVQAVSPGISTIRFIATNAAGCTDSTDVAITVNGLPAMQPITSASNSFSVCEQSILQLNNTTTRQTDIWKSLQPNVAGIDAAGKLTALLAGTATIRFIATNTAGCTDSTDAPVTVIPLLTPSVAIAASVNPICEGTAVEFTAQGVNGGTAPRWQWLLNGTAAGGGNPAFKSSTLKNGDEISCRFTSNTTCTLHPIVYSNTIRMQVNPLPVLTISSDRTTILKGDMAQLQATATGTIGVIAWTPASDLNNGAILNPIARSLTTTVYRLTVTSKEDCTSSGTIQIMVVDQFLVPNAFSPNGDGINDRWEIDYLEKFPGASIQVFNRYGQPVYNTTNYQRGNGWDGRINGQPLPMGAYYYIIDLKNGRTKFSGSVTLLK